MLIIYNYLTVFASKPKRCKKDRADPESFREKTPSKRKEFG